MVESVTLSGEFLMLDGDMEIVSNLIIQYVDYGDNFYDILIVRKDGNLFGSSILAGLSGIEKTIELTNELKEKTGIAEVVRVEE